MVRRVDEFTKPDERQALERVVRAHQGLVRVVGEAGRLAHRFPECGCLPSRAVSGTALSLIGAGLSNGADDSYRSRRALPLIGR